MPFQKGQSGNPGGRKRSLGLSRAVRASEGLKTWAMLLKVRDGEILEPYFNKETEKTEWLPPGAKTRTEACRLILAYCWGTPGQKTEMSNDMIIDKAGDRQTLIFNVANALLRGDLPAAAASSLASLIQTSVRIREVEEFEQRLKAIEERLSAREGGMQGQRVGLSEPRNDEPSQ